MKDFAFSYNENNQFCADNCLVKDLADKYGTPLSIISLTQLIGNIRRFQNAFSTHWQGKVRVLPAIKANTSLALCQALAKETEGCDLFSEGELRAAIKSGFKPELLSLNGNSKLTADMKFLEYAINQGVRITIDDKSEFESIESTAARLNKPVTVRLRLKPAFPGMNVHSDFIHGIPLASEYANFAYKAGVPTEDLEELGKRILNSKWLNLSGVHLHLGRHRKEVSYWETIMKGYAKAIYDLKQSLNGWEPTEIDIGGGFAQTFDPFPSYKQERSKQRAFRLLDFINKTVALFGDGMRYKTVAAILNSNKQKQITLPGPVLNKSKAPTIEEYSLSAAYLRRELNQMGIETQDKVLELEPGRALYGDTGIHVCRVSFIKHQTTPIPWSWVITDTTDYWLQGADDPSNIPYVVDGKPIDLFPTQDRMIADIAGKSCSPDRISGDACLPGNLKSGDLIIFIGTGAYSEMRSPSFNSMQRPATVAVYGNQEGLIKRRETIDDVLKRETIPDWI